LKKTSIHGGTPITVCDSPDSFGGGSWTDDNHIIAVLGIPFGLSRIDVGGGTPRLLAKPADHKQEVFRAPQILPGGEAVLYTANNAYTNYDEASIEVLTWKTGRWKTLVRGGYHGRYLPGGYLVWISHRTLFGTLRSRASGTKGHARAAREMMSPATPRQATASSISRGMEPSSISPENFSKGR
jgi:serine/threonine-protein kinase